jgi:tripartite-type tricarboxylate transporter receptor subunit TctC
MRRREFAIGGIAALSGAASLPARAQAWPSRNVHFVVPFTAGSATDTVARSVGATMTANIGQTVVVENKPGAGGTIGAGQVAKAAPDGHTLLVHSSAHTVNPSMYPTLTYDTVKDLQGVSMLATLPNVLVVSPAKGWKTLQDMVKAAKADAGKINYASAGAGSATHMNIEKFRLSAGFQGTHVPYKGTPEAVTDVMGGRVDMFFAPVIASLGLIREGKLVALGIGGAKRSSVLPDVPTTEEAGFAGSAYNFWVGMMAPAGVPADIVARLNAEVVKALGSAEVKGRLQPLGADAAPMDAASFNQLISREVEDNARLVREAGIKLS